MLTTHTLAATVHGRFLVRAGPPQRLLIGFHGYAETAEVHIEELSKIRGVEDWTVVSVQALHPFYTALTQQIAASWMTKLDRELAIADNIAYVRSVREWFQSPKTVAFAGYSQGGAMAYRAASDFARAAGVSVRTLQSSFKRDRHVTPMQYLRNLRLDAARARLLAGTAVSEAALDTGFSHQGRFAQYYRSRFGHSPSSTCGGGLPPTIDAEAAGTEHVQL